MTGTLVVTAVGGAQQAAAAKAFAAEGWNVRGTVRAAAKAVGSEVFAADLETGAGLDAAFDGVDVIAFTLPQDHRPGTMTRMTAEVVDAAGRAGVTRLILNLAGTIDESTDAPLAVDLRAVRDEVRNGAVPFVLIQPTVFMDNLRAPWSLPAIVGDGVLVYPAPEDAPISWLSHQSLAQFIVAAASVPQAVGRDLHVGGPDALTGRDLASILSDRLGRSVTYRRVSLDGFAAGLNQALGAPAGDRVASLYARLDVEPDAMAVGDEARTLLQVEPETFAAFVARHNWLSPRA